MPYDEDGYESYDSKEENEEDDGQEGSGEEDEEVEVTSEEEEEEAPNNEEKKEEEDPSDLKSVAPTPSVSEVSTAATSTAASKGTSKANRHCCAHK